MISYKLSVPEPASHYIAVELTIDQVSGPQLDLQLPAWRPGRYELGNFAKNIRKVQVFDANGTALPYVKITKDLWQIDTRNSSRVTITYSYFASEINAGSCYADDSQLYVNPVHLCMYVPQRMQEIHELRLDIPSNYRLATSLPRQGNVLKAASFDELADSPFMASEKLQSHTYEVGGVLFWLHFLGECRPDLEKITTDFSKFTKTQIDFWGSFPVPEYHFMFQVLPYKFYHGVEHQHSTVIAIGPGYALNKGKTYEDVLGVSSHELFHTWNVKYIRPAEMLPYDFSKENYARTGYVYEGFTTYYGDVMLLSSGVFSVQQYFDTLEERLVKHFHSNGRLNLSVAASSWETWLDGYVPGAPYRKTSIYDEGNLVALMLDVQIMKHSGNTKGLRDVCRALYHLGREGRGYTEQDIRRMCTDAAGADLSDFFERYVYGTIDFTGLLEETFAYLGIVWERKVSPHLCESRYGFKTIDAGNSRKVSLLAPGSPALLAGLSAGDEILAVNGYALRGDFNEWMSYFGDETIELSVVSAGRLKTMFLTSPSPASSFFEQMKLTITDTYSDGFTAWLNLNK